MQLCPICGLPIHGDQERTKIDAFEVTGKDARGWKGMETESFLVHDQPCGEKLRKQLARIKDPKGKKVFMLKLFKKLSD